MIRFLPILLCSTLHAAALGTDTDGILDFNQFNTFHFITNQFPTNVNAWVNARAGFLFSTPTPMYLHNLIVPVHLSASAPETVTFTLYTGTTFPLTAIESASLVLPNDNTFALREFAFSGNTLLTPGVNYFMVGSVPVSYTLTTHVAWAGSNPGVSVPFVRQVNNQFTGPSGWNPGPMLNGPAWQIDTNIPEPGTAVGVALALLFFVLWGKARLTVIS